MRSPLRPWLLVVPLGTFGVLAGHQLAYALTGTSQQEIHGYLDHLPEVALLLTVLSVIGASFVERGSRLALWPYPAVTVVGYVAQEHLERLADSGSVPLLLDKPFFLVGLVLQVLVAIVAWWLAQLLVRLVGSTEAARSSRTRGGVEPRAGIDSGAPRGALACSGGPRAPPLAL